jgi:hypothetical protein
MRFSICIFLLLSACCTDNNIGEPVDVDGSCTFTWVAEDRLCNSKIEISRNHAVFTAETVDGFHILAVFEGWFPEELNGDALPTMDAYIAVSLPLSEGWCGSMVDRDPPQGGMTLKFNEDGDVAEVDLEAYVACDGEGLHWRRFNVEGDTKVVWVE